MQTTIQNRTEFVDISFRFFPTSVSNMPPSFNTIFAILAMTTQDTKCGK